MVNKEKLPWGLMEETVPCVPSTSLVQLRTFRKGWNVRTLQRHNDLNPLTKETSQ